MSMGYDSFMYVEHYNLVNYNYPSEAFPFVVFGVHTLGDSFLQGRKNGNCPRNQS